MTNKENKLPSKELETPTTAEALDYLVTQMLLNPKNQEILNQVKCNLSGKMEIEGVEVE